MQSSHTSTLDSQVDLQAPGESRSEPKTITTDELERDAWLGPLDRALPGLAAILLAAAGFTLVAAWGHQLLESTRSGAFNFTVSALQLVIAAGIVVVVVMLLHNYLFQMQEGRVDWARKELKRRFGQDGISAELQALETNVLTMPAEAWAILFSGRHPGTNRIFWFKLYCTGSTVGHDAEVTYFSGAPLDFGASAGEQLSSIRRGRKVMPVISIPALPGLLRRADTELRSGVAARSLETVGGGMSCKVGIIGGGMRWAASTAVTLPLDKAPPQDAALQQLMQLLFTLIK